MAGKLKRLSAITQEALKQLACLGNVAEIATLALVHGKTEEAMNAALWEAIHAGLVFREDSTYKFPHDRIRQAAYTLIPEEERPEVHLRIGRVLLASMTADELAEHLFDVANQLNRGAAGLIDRDEKAQVATIDLRAGRKAKASAAYVSACVYLETGMALLDDTDWGSQYELTYRLWLGRAECELLTSNFEKAEQLVADLLPRVASKIDRAAVYYLKVQLHVVKSEVQQGVDSALTCLRQFGIDITAHPTWDQVEAEYETVWQTLNGRSIESLIDLPLMTDPELQAAMQVLSVLTPASFLTDFHLFCLLACRMVKVGIQHGISGASAHGYALLGYILGSVFHRYPEGYCFAKLACNLIEKHGFIAYQAKVYHATGLIGLWTQPIANAIALQQAAFRTAIETGDLAFACYSLEHSLTDLLLRNDPLDAVWRESEVALDFHREAKYGDAADIIRSQQRFVATMQGRTATFSTFSDAQFDEAAFEAQLTGDRMTLMICWYWILKLKARFLSGDYAEALAAADKAKPLLWAAAAQINLLDYFYYTALTVAALYENATADEQNRWRELLTAHREQLREWAENYPPTFGDKHALVSAEIARVEGRDLDAMRLYEEAIRAARENGFVQNEGLADELAAQFYLKRGIEKVAHSYLRDGRYCYLRWGALGKVRQLDERYPAIEEQASLRPITTIGTSVEQLDLGTVMKASHAVAGEIVLEKLIETLLVIAVEHAGAECGLLILSHGEELRIAAEARTGREGVEVKLQDALVRSSDLPDSLLHYVIRTQESVILDEASTQNLFSLDEYVSQRRPRSVLCLPLVKQVKLVGVLYLENSLASRVFTPKRLAMLEMLASQAAISLDHARLYADLGRLNAELTQENSDRRKAEESLRASEQRLQDIVDNTTAVIFVKDLELRYLLVNCEFERLHQVQRKQIRGKTDFELHPPSVAEIMRANDRRVIEAGEPIQFEEVVPSLEGQRAYVSAKFLLRDRTGKPYAVCGIATDITALKRAEESQASMARERELFARQRATELANANEALRGCLDALASVPELDEFLGQVMAAMTRQLGAASSVLRWRSYQQNCLTLDLVFQDGRVMTPGEAKYPEKLQSVPLDERQLGMLKQPATVMHLLDDTKAIPVAHRAYLLGLGVKTLLVIPLVLAKQLIGSLTFRFTDDREFRQEEIEIARALASQASLAIHLTRLAKAARQSAVLEERNQLAGEIHDSLAQFFTGITMQLGAAKEVIKAASGNVLSYLERASDLAHFGLAEARRSAFSLHPTIVEELGLLEVQKLVERSNIPGRLRCNFHSTGIPEEKLPSSVQQDLLRIAQEAMSNAVRHAKPTIISVNLRCHPPNLVLEVTDNGSGIDDSEAARREGFGFSNMRARAENIGAQLEVGSAAGRGTTIVVHLPIQNLTL
jgi:PAS domain S-box-containing protein